MIEVLIIYGGDSVESEISAQSANGILKSIDQSRFTPSLINVKDLKIDSIKKDAVVFIAVHGSGGEDGETQKLLAANGIKFTGSGASSARLCWDKISSKALMEKNKIPTPPYKVIKKDEKFDLNGQFFLSRENFFVKPNSNGSSFGVSKVTDIKLLDDAIKEARKFSDDVIIEEAYNSAEYTVGILKGEALEPLEIIANDHKGFYDYQAKYLSKKTKKVEVVDKEIKKELQKIALKAFYQHGCQTWGRVDFVFNGKEFGVLEINTVPGFTENSLFPLAAKISGINYQELITRIIEDSI
jgi:D-alanine-D-alanine ligase